MRYVMRESRGVVVLVVLFLSGLVSVASAGAAGSCSNETVRAEQGSTFLPDCRAYELVSPGSNPLVGSEAAEGAEAERASVTGEGIAYASRYPAVGASRSGFDYLARRGSGGWSVEEVEPQSSPEAAEELLCEPYVYFSADLSRSVLSDGWDIAEQKPGESYCQSSEEQLAAGAPAGYGNLYYREGSGPYSLVNVTPNTAVPANARLQDASEDLGHVLFSEEAKLTGIGTGEEAPAGYDLYEWSGGTVRLVTFLPNGKPVEGRLADGGNHKEGGGTYEGYPFALAPDTHAMSVDGERVFFYAEHEGSLGLYLREHAMRAQSVVYSSGPNVGKVNGEQCEEPAKACTIEIDVSHGVGASGGGVFWDASVDGSRVFFADERNLTAGAGAATEEPDLYEYDVVTKALVDVTPEALAGGPANARGFSGASEDGSYLYFVADGAFVSTHENGEKDIAQAGKPNLYLYHEGTLTFIATLRGESGHYPSEQDFSDWQEEGMNTNKGELSARVSPNGIYIGFTSINEVTHFNNTDASTHKSDKEIFLYDAADNGLVCVSCVPGERPSGNTELPLASRFSQKPFGVPAYLSRNVLDDGRVFFTTPNALIPSLDTNGEEDVYEYEEGQVHLISGGKGSGGSVFYDASESGNDVFFVTGQSLVAADKDGYDSIYDARVGGGFEAESAAVEPEPCKSEEGCRAPAHEAPSEQFPASSTLAGPGNLLAPSPKPEEVAKRALTRAQKLANALKACKRKPKSRRKSCEAQARKRFGGNTKSKAKAKKKGAR